MTSNKHRDFYEVLGISRDSDEKTIKNAFRQLALKYHPDRNKAPDAEEKFKEIAEAYAILSDPKKRAAYDQGGYAGVSGVSPEDLYGGINFEEIFKGSGFGFNFAPNDFGIDFGGSIFNRFFSGGGRGENSGGTQGENLEVPIEIPLEHVATGGYEKVRVVRYEHCSQCNGSGAKTGTKPRYCKTCQGTGKKTTVRREGGMTLQQVSTCPDCLGRGNFIDKPCPNCNGSGKIGKEETITVNIPAGVEEGMVLRVPGGGAASVDSGGRPGDLLVIVRSRPDIRFERRGENLWRTETIEVPDATLGIQLTVPTLEGQAKVKVPAGTQPDTVLRLKSKGLPIFGAKQGNSGDLFIRIQIKIPQGLSVEERKLYERLRMLAIKR